MKDVELARQLFRSLAPLSMLGVRIPWKVAETYCDLRRRVIRAPKTIDGIISTACIEANLPLLFIDRDFSCPYVEHLGLEVA